MIFNLLLLLITTLTLTNAQNSTCPTNPPSRRDTIQCFTYPRSSCVTDIGVYSNITSLFIGNSSRVTLETELRVLEVLYRFLINVSTTQEDGCIGFYRTLACLYLYTPCHEGRPLTFCEESCVLIQNSRCTVQTSFFAQVSDEIGQALFEEFRIPACSMLNDRVLSYPPIPNVDYSEPSNCTYVGLPGALNAHMSGEVKLVTNDTHNTNNIFETSTHGIVQVLNYQADIWGDVCIAEGTSDSEIQKIAQVACRSIGFPGGVTQFTVGPPANASGYYMIDQISCNGNESRLSDCEHNGYDFKYCAPDRRLHVICNKEVGTVVLGGESTEDDSISGVPIIQLNEGVVAEFCFDTFNNSIGKVICRHINNMFQNISVSIMPENNVENRNLTTFSCEGSEDRVLQCDYITMDCPSNRRVRLTCEVTYITEPMYNGITLAAIQIVTIAASIIIFILLLIIAFVTCVFYSYRKETKKQILNSETRANQLGLFYMQQIDAGTTSMPRSVNNTVYQSTNGQRVIDVDVHMDYLVRPNLGHVNIGTSIPDDNEVTGMPHIPGSPIQNYMITTMGTDSLPLTDHMLSISFLQDYCGSDIRGYVIPGTRLEMGDKLGEGAFGIVYKGKILDKIEGEFSDDVEPHDEVAVKTLKDPGNDQELKDLLLECALLKDLQHTNILGLLAVTYFGNRPYLIIPYMANGDLKAYLKSVREKALNSMKLPEELSEKLLANMSLEIARGMEYLTNKRYVHRDLAARNCMVDANFSIKVSDFGLSREIYVDDYYRQKKGAKLPAKWMAPESLEDGICNEKTDVWSFGVTLWEVYSLGRNPYPGVSNSEMVSFLNGGKRMERPRLCPEVMYEMMQYCWQYKPLERPTFSIVSNYLESLKFEDNCDVIESNIVTRDAIQEEEEKLHGIEYTEDSLNRRKLFRQDAVHVRMDTPFTPSQPVGFEHLASRFEEATRKVFLMQCIKSVSMDSARFSPAEHYTIPHLSMSIPIIDEEHLQRTRSLNTVRKKHTSLREELKKKSHTMISSGSSPKKQEESSKKAVLQVPKERRGSNSARARWKKLSQLDKHSNFSKSK